jgi:hypothetical protein
LSSLSYLNPSTQEPQQTVNTAPEVDLHHLLGNGHYIEALLEAAIDGSEVQEQPTSFIDDYNEWYPDGEVLEEAVALEQEVEEMPTVDPVNGTEKGYHHATPTPSEQAAGAYNCTVYLAAVLKRAGYDLRQEITVGGVTAPIEDFINIRNEVASAEQLEEGDAFVIVFPDLQAGDTTLAQLVRDEDPRIQGVASALSIAGLGAPVEHVDELRPGDMIQTWNEPSSGHSTLIHSVEGMGPNGRQTLGPDSEARELELTNVTVDQLGAHYPRSATDPTKFEPRQRQHPDDQRPGDTVHIHEDVNLNDYDHWFGVRPTTSKWPR